MDEHGDLRDEPGPGSPVEPPADVEFPMRVAEKAALVKARFKELDRFLAAVRIAVASPDGNTTVTVDGFGELFSINVQPPALARGHTRDLGRSIVAAVTEARSKAAAVRLEEEARLFPES